ncbi:hypothetical protein D3C81_940130 [compost metagenome]
MAKRKYKSQLMVPGANSTMYEMRFEIAKKLEYINDETPNETWWDNLTPMQQSTVNGQVTKLLVMKAQKDMMDGKFKH